MAYAKPKKINTKPEPILNDILDRIKNIEKLETQSRCIHRNIELVSGNFFIVCEDCGKEFPISAKAFFNIERLENKMLKIARKDIGLKE